MTQTRARTKPEAAKAPVTMRALTQRINRKLAKGERTGDPEQLRAHRIGFVEGEPVWEYLLIDLNINGVVGHDVDPEELARKLGVLQPWEQVVTNEG